MMAIFIEALLHAGLGLFALTFILVSWRQKSGEPAELVGPSESDDTSDDPNPKEDSLPGLEARLDRALKKVDRHLDKSSDDGEAGEVINPLQKKWIQFGGGFYGVVALATYLLFEFHEVIELIRSIGAILRDLVNQPVSLAIRAAIDFLVDSILNLVAAVTWPVYWMSKLEGREMWIWLGVAYAGYYAGLKFAKLKAERQQLDPQDI